MRDNNLIFNSNATISGSASSAIVAINKAPDTGFWIEVVANASSGTAQELNAQVIYSDSSSFAGVADFGPSVVWKDSSTPPFRKAVLCQTRKAYARILWTVGGTSPSFAGVYAHVDSGPERNDVPGVNTV
jgi:hypothetical protein